MSGALVLFEDARWQDLSPLSDLMPVPALAFGASDLATRWRRAANLPLLAVEARPGPWAGLPGGAGRVPEPASPGQTGDDEVLVVNAAAIPGP